MMNAVGVVPVDSEIAGRRFQTGHAADGLIGVGNAGGVRVLRYAPDSLDGLVVSHQLLDHIHVRAALVHGNVDHLDAKILGDGKVTVITRNRAEELHLVELAPGSASHDAVGHGAGNGVVHHIQAGVSVDNNIVRGYLDHVGDQLLGLSDAVQNAVVPAVGAVLADEVVLAAQNVHHSHGEIQLLGAGLTSGHIKL